MLSEMNTEILELESNLANCSPGCTGCGTADHVEENQMVCAYCISKGKYPKGGGHHNTLDKRYSVRNTQHEAVLRNDRKLRHSAPVQLYLFVTPLKAMSRMLVVRK